MIIKLLLLKRLLPMRYKKFNKYDVSIILIAGIFKHLNYYFFFFRCLHSLLEFI